MKLDLGKLKTALPKVNTGDGNGFRMDPGFSFYFQVGSWVFAVAVLVMFLLSKFVWHLEMGGATMALWIIAPLICVPAFFLMYKTEDDFKEWQLLTVFSFVTLALLSIAMYTWIDTAHGTFDKDMFFDIVSKAKYTVVIWAVYAIINLAGFLLMVFTQEREPKPEPEAVPEETPVEEIHEETPVVAGYRHDMDVILADIERFSAPSGFGMVEREEKGGN